MTRGLKDWIKPAIYSYARRSKDTITATKNATTTIKSIDGQGETLGGYLVTSDSQVHPLISYVVNIDGAEVFNETMEWLLGGAVNKPESGLLFIAGYSLDASYYMTALVSPGYTFISNITFEVVNPYGIDLDLDYALYYKLIP